MFRFRPTRPTSSSSARWRTWKATCSGSRPRICTSSGPELSSTDDCEFTYGEDLKTFLPNANFRKPAQSVEVGAWDTDGKAEITGKAQKR